MDCHDVRRRLAETNAPASGEVREHLERCARCARYADRAHAAREIFREHHARVEPDAGFASRVALRLESDTSQALGWAAARLLPATLALVIVLAWLSLQATEAPASTTEVAPTDDLVSWVIEQSGENR